MTEIEETASGEPPTGVNSLHAPVRQRFTIAHELGHAVLHAREGIHLDQAFRLRFRDQTSAMAIDPEEIDANSFAAELLMPADELNRVWVLRKVLNPLSPAEAMELLLGRLSKSKSNAEFLASMSNPS